MRRNMIGAKTKKCDYSHPTGRKRRWFFSVTRELPRRRQCLYAAMQLVRRLLSLLLACLVLMWAGAASAQDACDSAFELADQGQVEHLSQLVFDGDGGDPQDCPGIVSVFAQPSRLLLEVRPTPVLPAFSPILPRPTSPPPRRV